MSNDYRLYPLGDSGIVVSFGDEINFGIHKRIQQFTEVLEQSLCKGMIEYVPAFTTVTIYYDPWIMSEKEEEILTQQYLHILKNCFSTRKKNLKRSLDKLTFRCVTEESTART